MMSCAIAYRHVFNSFFFFFCRSPPVNNIICRGELRNTNTVEAFKDLDKSSLMNEMGERIRSEISSGRALHDPNLLFQFILITFAVRLSHNLQMYCIDNMCFTFLFSTQDLKKYNFFYWFGFPALVDPLRINLAGDPRELAAALPEDKVSPHSLIISTQIVYFSVIQMY